MTANLRRDEVELDVNVPCDGGWRIEKIRKQGRLFSVGGIEIAMFPVSVVALAVEREVKCIHRWERAKQWPKPQWLVPDKRCKRWYSGAQINAIHTEYKRVSKGSYGFSHSPHFPLSEFLKWVRTNFRTFDVLAIAKLKETGK